MSGGRSISPTNSKSVAKIYLTPEMEVTLKRIQAKIITMSFFIKYLDLISLYLSKSS